jgi:type II secretory pathway pseudopilin PulG
MKVRVQAQRAFTIVELLIAATMTIVIVAMLGTMLGSLMGTASHANQRIDSFREARSALQLIERDLAGLIHAPSSAYFLVTNLTYSDPATTKARQNKPFGTSNAPGDLCAVGYYSSWDATNHCYALHRYFRDSAATFNFFKGLGAGKYVSPITLYAPGTTDETIASYVWNMQVTCYKADGTIDTTFPMEVGLPGVTLPAAIEVSFTAMSSSAAKPMMSASSNPNDWMTTTSKNYQTLIAPHAYQFRTRINLP